MAREIKQHSTITMDLLDELDNLAINAAYEEPEDDISLSSSNEHKGIIKMWQDLFGYSCKKAVELISITQTTKKPTPSSAIRKTLLSPAQARTVYALKLEGPFSTP